MIRKVPNMSAWVMQAKDYRKWTYTACYHAGYQVLIPLPLFELMPDVTYTSRLFGDNELIVVVDLVDNNRPFTLEQVKEINKTWNKFYEESTRK